MLAAALQEHSRALIVGTQPSTCGCLVGVSRTLQLPDGGKLNVSDVDYLTARGRRVEGTGVRADHLLEPRLEDLRARRDRALEWAVDRLTRSIQSDAGGPPRNLSTTHANR